MKKNLLNQAKCLSAAVLLSVFCHPTGAFAETVVRTSLPTVVPNPTFAETKVCTIPPTLVSGLGQLPTGGCYGPSFTGPHLVSLPSPTLTINGKRPDFDAPVGIRRIGDPTGEVIWLRNGKQVDEFGNSIQPAIKQAVTAAAATGARVSSDPACTAIVRTFGAVAVAKSSPATKSNTAVGDSFTAGVFSKR
jgi:hypothetical protein